MIGWSELPYDVLVLIANKLVDLADFISFSVVCRHWNTVYLKKEWDCSQRSPWLMLNGTDVSKRKFFSFSSFKFYSFPVQEPYNCRFWGTSQGWIAMFSEDFVLRLFNPITRVCIEQPSLRNVIQTLHASNWFSEVEKADVFNLQGKIAIAIIGNQSCTLALTIHGDGYWATVQFPTTVFLSDVVCFNDQILAVTMTGMLFVVDVNVPDGPKAYYAASPPQGLMAWWNLYLAKSQSRLLLVIQCKDSWKRFEVYELDVPKGRWCTVDDLRGQALLVDDYNCMSVSANVSFKDNCIYHVSDNSLSSTDYLNQQTWLTVDNIKDETSKSVLISKHSLVYICPLWMVPAIW